MELRPGKKISKTSVLALLISVLITLILCIVFTQYNATTENLKVEQLVTEKSARINEIVFNYLYKAQALKTFIIHGNGRINEFDSIAGVIVDDPVIKNVLLAPDGVVTEVFPLKGNEAVVGLNFFAKGSGNKEAILAKETEQLVFGGPFNAVQGGQIVVGRLPVFIDNENGEHNFWGIVSVTLSYPEIFDDAELSQLTSQGYIYEIWRINPDNNERQIIAGNTNETNYSLKYFEKPLSIANAQWYFRIYSDKMWFNYIGVWFLLGFGIIISVLICSVFQGNYKLTNAHNLLETQHEIIISSIDYSSKIQKNLLPKNEDFEKAFSDYSIIWHPRDTVGGDIYWLKNFDVGTILCVCDCTGHGVPGAMLTMLVTSAFESTVNENNCQDTAQIIWELEKKLTSTLNVELSDPNRRALQKGIQIYDGCDIAVLYIAKDGAVKISAANTRVYICDGREVTQIKGQKLHIGDGTLKGKEDISIISVPPNPENKFYIASDGLYEQIGGQNSLPFGYGRLKTIILENHNETQSVISEKIWQEFETYRGSNERRDDFELVTFKP